MRAMQVTQVAEPFKAILDRAARCEFSVTELRDRLSALDRFKLQMLDFYRDYDVIICPVATGPASSYEKTLAAKEGFNLANDRSSAVSGTNESAGAPWVGYFPLCGWDAPSGPRLRSGRWTYTDIVSLVLSV
jgi:hypothetical protein